MNKLVSRSFRLGNTKYPALRDVDHGPIDLKREVLESMNMFDGKPDEMTVSRISKSWVCTAEDAQVLATLENPTQNKYYRLAFIMVKFSPLLSNDPGVGKLTIVNDTIVKEKRLSYPIVSLEFSCSEHCTYISGSDQWIESAEGKVSVVSQCTGSIAKPGSNILITDAVIVYQHSARPRHIKAISCMKRSGIVEEDRLSNYIEEEPEKYGHV